VHQAGRTAQRGGFVNRVGVGAEMQEEGSSFSEEKEAKRLLFLLPPFAADTLWGKGRQQERKFFGSFFQKRTFFLHAFSYWGRAPSIPVASVAP
jgi:hypothetical protein